MKKWRSWFLLALTLASWPLTACRGDAVPGFRVLGKPAKWSPTQFAAWVPTPTVDGHWVAGDMEDPAGPALLDTGSPVTVLASGNAGGNDRGLSSPSPCNLDLLGIRLESPVVIPGRVLPSRSDLTGIIGADILSQFCLAVDYQADRAALFADCMPPPNPPSAVESWSSVRYVLAGGGVLHLSDGTILQVPATRILLPLVIEDRAVVALLDTGASSLVLSPGLADALLETDPDRPVLSGLSVTTVDGDIPGWMTRAATVSLGDAELASVPSLVVDDPSLFSYLQAETGAFVQALVGETFLRSFTLALDQRHGQLWLARYRADSHLDPDEFVFVGLSLQDTDRGIEIDRVYPDRDAAAQGVEPGDLVARVDGQTPTDAADAACRILLHTEGDRVSLGLVRANRNLSVQILVENLLPDYPGPKTKSRSPARPGRGFPWWTNQHLGLTGPVVPCAPSGGSDQ